MEFSNIVTKKLVQHEKVSKRRLSSLIKEIKNDGGIKNPILVDKNTLVNLDGHHRINAAIALGLSTVPCYLVEYLSDSQVQVFSRRKHISVTKELVIKHALSGNLFPYKTTRHHLLITEYSIISPNLIPE